MENKALLAALGFAVVLQGCSSKPREFSPTVSLATSQQAAFDAAYADCHRLMVEGKLDSSGRLASGAAGVAAGATTMAAGAAAATSAGLYAGAAVASATVVAIPFVALASMWGMSKHKRNKKEKAIKTVMAGCLRERGYDVAGWTRAPQKSRPMSASSPG